MWVFQVITGLAVSILKERVGFNQSSNDSCIDAETELIAKFQYEA